MKQQIKKSILFSATAILLSLAVQAQKKLVPATQSTLTGIALPAGSKNDSRMLSVMAAKILLQDEAKKTGTSIKDVEILYLPSAAASGFTFDSLASQFAAQGWNISPAGSDNKYAWLQKNDQYIFAYYSAEKNVTNLYFGQPTAAPALNTNTINNTNMQQGTQNNESIQQPTQETNNTNAVQQNTNTVDNTLPAQQNGFAFSTTNFDDGWNSVIQDDWVLVSKGDMKVYLWYALPYNASDFSGTGIVDRDYYWDNYVSKYYTIETKQYKDNGEVLSSQKPPYVEGWATDKQTGERRFIGMRLDISPNTAYITIGAAKDEAALWAQFPKANGGAWSPSDLSNMSSYNKFAIGENDILGTWQDGNTSAIQWYYTAASGNPGGYAGMTVAARSATFNFNPGGDYTSIHNGATGAVGAMNTFQQNYKGKYTVTNWGITATNRWDGKTENFNSWFKIIRGGRILCMDTDGMQYRLVKAK